MQYFHKVRQWLFLHKKKILIFFASIFTLGVVTLGFLEYLSRRCEYARMGSVSCVELLRTYVSDEATHTYFQNSFSNTFLPQSLDVDTIVKSNVIYLDQEDMPGLNGIACTPYAFVSDALPSRAKRYVAYHEAIHLAGKSNNETNTNIKAAMREPIGFVQTVFYSIFAGFRGKHITEYPCVLGGIWKTFKVYFLGGSF